MSEVAPVASAPTSAPAPVASAPAVESAPVATPAASAPTESIANTAPAEVSSPSSSGSLLDPSPASTETAVVGDLPPASDVLQVAPQVTDWRKDLPLEYRNNPNINKYNSLEDMMNGQLNLVKKLGEKGIQIPDEGADQATWDSYYTRTGRPESAEDYTNWEGDMQVDADGNETPKFDLDPEMYKQAKEHFHGMGLTDKQQLAVMGFYAKTTTQGQEQFVAEQAQQAQQAKSELHQEYGDHFDAKMRSVSAIADSLGVKQTLIENGLGNNPAVIKMLDKIGGMIGESRITGDVQNSADGFDNKLQAINAKLATVQKSSPEYAQLHQARLALYKKQY
jgi:hypothetical protein